MLKEYREYSRDNPRGLWFKERWYGWGWVPVKWQGWATIGAFVVVIILNGIYLESLVVQGADPSRNDFLIFFGVIVVAVSLLFWICFRKGERPHWNWGDPRKKE